MKIIQGIQVFSLYFEENYSSIKKNNNSIFSVRTLAMIFLPSPIAGIQLGNRAFGCTFYYTVSRKVE